MKCGGCVSTVEKILNNSDGIKNVSVNLLTESAYFEITQKHTEIEKDYYADFSQPTETAHSG